MEITAIHPNFIMPAKGTEKAGAFDVYMPELGIADGNTKLVGLGFAAAVPDGHVALLLPRSSAAKSGLELANTVGVIDSDYRGEWKAALRTKHGLAHSWSAGDRLLQFLVVPVANVTLKQVDSLDATERGAGGFGSTGS
jgi:dUTP pyrophosphatase